MKIAIIKSNGQITGVYVSPDLIENIDYIDYDHDLTSRDEVIEEAIDASRVHQHRAHRLHDGPAARSAGYVQYDSNQREARQDLHPPIDLQERRLV